ncbi:hypothetical protein D0Z00_001291 [Geotrichum galactomycetum]|uniref:Uncharacterized protein n=1 Tax=Geotrichum galactomycetum TaxID=27317 RepID=A0ACB6V7D9_9ASCO|nr:hypothetical protein D0Z00_001291 [Geotrichum candidum]
MTGGGLFGNTANTNATTTTGSGLFGNNNASTPASTGTSLFGNKPATTTTGGSGFSLGGTSNAATNSTTTTPATGGLFGNTSNNTSTTTSGGLFGSTTATAGSTASTTTGSGLFGNTANNSTTTGGGLFGKPSTTTTTTTPTTGGGLFGSSSNTTNSTVPRTGGLFGNTSTTTGSTGGLFGGSGTGTATTGLFGANNTNTTTNNTAAAGGLFKNDTNQPVIPVSQITGTTRPGSLPPQAQLELVNLEMYIKKQTQISEKLKSRHDELDEMVDSVPRDAELLVRKLTTAVEALKYDEAVLGRLKAESDGATADSETCFNLFGHLRGTAAAAAAASAANGGAGGARLYSKRIGAGFLTSAASASAASKPSDAAGASVPDPLIPFFEHKIEEFRQKLAEYARIIQEAENGIDSIIQSSSQVATTNGGGAVVAAVNGGANINGTEEGLIQNVNAILAALQEEYLLFMGLGNRVAELHHNVGRLEEASKQTRF